MPLKHVVFDGQEVESIWQTAALAWVVDEVRRVGDALRDEIRYAHGRVDKVPPWPPPRGLQFSAVRMAEAALNLAAFRAPAGVAASGTEGGVPDGFVRVGEFEGSVLYVRRDAAGLAMALEWEAPASAYDPTRLLR